MNLFDKARQLAGRPARDPEKATRERAAGKRNRRVASAARRLSIEAAREVLDLHEQGVRGHGVPYTINGEQLPVVEAAYQVLAAQSPSEAYWRRRHAEMDARAAQDARAVAELAEAMPLTEARQHFDRDVRVQVARLECGHDDESDCAHCHDAYAGEYGPNPPDYRDTAIRSRAVTQIMHRYDPGAVEAAEHTVRTALEHADTAREQMVDRAARGMTYDEARVVLDKQDRHEYSSFYPCPDSRQVDAARRVHDGGPPAAISRTQPLPVVPARLAATATNAALLLPRGEEAAAERAVREAGAGHNATGDDEQSPTEHQDGGLPALEESLASLEHTQRQQANDNARNDRVADKDSTEATREAGQGAASGFGFVAPTQAHAGGGRDEAASTRTAVAAARESVNNLHTQRLDDQRLDDERCGAELARGDYVTASAGTEDTSTDRGAFGDDPWSPGGAC